MVKRVFLLATLLLSVSCIKDKPEGADLSVGDQLPDFHVTMNDGTSVSRQDMSKGVSLIMFFHTTCPDCQNTLPVIQTIYDEYSQSVAFALISRAEESQSIEEYWIKEGFTMPYSAQETREVYELFAQTRVPREYINKDGVIKAIFTDIPSNPSYEEIKSVLDSLL